MEEMWKIYLENSGITFFVCHYNCQKNNLPFLSFEGNFDARHQSRPTKGSPWPTRQGENVRLKKQQLAAVLGQDEAVNIAILFIKWKARTLNIRQARCSIYHLGLKARKLADSPPAELKSAGDSTGVTSSEQYWYWFDARSCLLREDRIRKKCDFWMTKPKNVRDEELKRNTKAIETVYTFMKEKKRQVVQITF